MSTELKPPVGIQAALVFVAGISVGAFADDLYHRALQNYWWEQESSARLTETAHQLARQLSLTDSQQAAVEPIVGQAYLELLELRLSQQPEVERIVTRSIVQLNDYLNPDQQDELGEIYAQIQNHWERSRLFLKQFGSSTPERDLLRATEPTQEASATASSITAAHP
ncbi:MAG: hypothetical protein U0231_04830 [Nitrospiraceae bacterium]